MMQQEEDALPRSGCLVAASVTPVTETYRPDLPRALGHARWLFERGCDGIALFGTTGEGPEFSNADRKAVLEHLLAGGVASGRIIVSVNAMTIPDIVDLARHALARGVHDLLLMLPCVFRSGITEDGVFRFYATVIDRIADPTLRLLLYHFPDICGVPVTPRTIRRLDERYPGLIAGVKDSGGDADHTAELIRRFSHLSIFTGTEVHLPQALIAGARGTVCGMANVMPQLMRAMMDLPTYYDKHELIASLMTADTILSRSAFIASAKAVLAGLHDDPAWGRVVPPMCPPTAFTRPRLVQDFMRWDASLPTGWRSMDYDPAIQQRKPPLAAVPA
ncbi:MAG: dihydrodipicolinate synthase family protein [Rhodocyclaceae bacterium]|nr:dihydrodipicolinate synthase family protein [Rhodocyclaceae bacterium]